MAALVESVQAVASKTFWELDVEHSTPGRLRAYTDGCLASERECSSDADTESTRCSSESDEHSDSCWSDECVAPPGNWAAPGRTTLMVKQLPQNSTQQSVYESLQRMGLTRQLDFFYAPCNFRKGCLFGYCFLNFTDHDIACEALNLLRAWSGTEVTWSDTFQGLDAQIARYRNCPVMHRSVPDDFKPMLFADGCRVPFPGPTEAVPPPRNMKKR